MDPSPELTMVIWYVTGIITAIVWRRQNKKRTEEDIKRVTASLTSAWCFHDLASGFVEPKGVNQKYYESKLQELREKKPNWLELGFIVALGPILPLLMLIFWSIFSIPLKTSDGN